ncbi:hypothetical protein BU16DRAFT_168425 [Lophium mytilinum]|uniref:Ph domain-containing protein n=1 Tax=Lophium mytilinum TaxID=390894 RepID=A0A6A6QER7_9PEZI|nr:hypothetical protein BU16DRAFT_168425 [Lophium mytilinum]
MTAAIGKYAAKKLLKGEMAKYAKKDVAGPYDPYFATVTDSRGKTRKVKKEIPDYIPDHQALILAKVRKRAYRLDCSLFNFLGFRFGWSSVVGIVPVAGDAIDGAMALETIRLCSKAKDKNFTLRRQALILMFLWLAIDIVVGLVPFVGDLADASFKANSRICQVLEKELDKTFKPNATKVPRPATVYEEFSEDELAGLRDSYEGDAGVQQPQRVRSSRRERQPDLEMGQAQVPSRSGTKTKYDSRRTAERDAPARSGTKGRR